MLDDLDRAGTRSITSRVRLTDPPLSAVPQSGQLLSGMHHRSRRHATDTPARARRFRGLRLDGAPLAGLLWPGIPCGPPFFSFASLPFKGKHPRPQLLVGRPHSASAACAAHARRAAQRSRPVPARSPAQPCHLGPVRSRAATNSASSACCCSASRISSPRLSPSSARTPRVYRSRSTPITRTDHRSITAPDSLESELSQGNRWTGRCSGAGLRRPSPVRPGRDQRLRTHGGSTPNRLLVKPSSAGRKREPRGSHHRCNVCNRCRSRCRLALAVR